jgi:hypothetical protein
MKFFNLRIFLTLLFWLSTSKVFPKEYIIYSVAQDIPMGVENEVIHKNYYVNMGSKQGLDHGTVLDVFRVISRADPYETKKRYNYRVKIGELKVLHTEDDSSITELSEIKPQSENIYFEIPSFMIGDHVEVKVN